jgi:hypothetical protein
MKRRLAVIVLAAVTAFGASGAHASRSLVPPDAVAKTCSSGYTHAVIGGLEKCLRAGEFCAHRYDTSTDATAIAASASTRTSVATG